MPTQEINVSKDLRGHVLPIQPNSAKIWEDKYFQSNQILHLTIMQITEWNKGLSYSKSFHIYLLGILSQEATSASATLK